MQTGHSAITSENALDRRYVDMNKKLKTDTVDRLISFSLQLLSTL